MVVGVRYIASCIPGVVGVRYIASCIPGVVGLSTSAAVFMLKCELNSCMPGGGGG